jgi:hypothetical protein
MCGPSLPWGRKKGQLFNELPFIWYAVHVRQLAGESPVPT